MPDWTFTEQRGLGGAFRLIFRKLTTGGRICNVTVLRGAPTQLESFSSSDPFGDSTAVFTFPNVSALDDLDGEELGSWLGYYSNVDLYWVPALPSDGSYPAQSDGGPLLRINPLTQLPDVIAPDFLDPAKPLSKRRQNSVKVWEGFVADMSFTTGANGTQLQVQCQGALFQVDRYLAKPAYPSRPWPIEKLIAQSFDRKLHPLLRTQPLQIQWPIGWTKKVPKYAGSSANVYAPVAKPGTNWTGYTSRNTGSWDHALTGFVQDNLQLLITGADCGVTPGNQWTVQHQRAIYNNRRGRQPVLMVRDRHRRPDFSVWVGQPGVDVELSGDSTQSENVIYGAGTDLDGQAWRNAVVSTDGTHTDYLPLAASRDVWPPADRTRKLLGLGRGAFMSEAYTNFGAGFGQEQATTVAEQQLARDIRPGWSGTITLSVDPNLNLPVETEPSMSRWLIRAGMTVQLKGFLGTGEDGFPLHIASVEASPMQGTVTLTVDSRYRDLLTVAEAQARTRDPLTPTRMLQVNKSSVMVEDVQAPWDYNAGSGFIPKESTLFYRHKPNKDIYPYSSWTRSHPPSAHGHWYVKVNANAKDSKKRWTRVPILTAERGTISRSEFFCVDFEGRPLKIPFHVSIYSAKVAVRAMPHLGATFSPYLDGAFESVDPVTGQEWPPGKGSLQADNTLLIGWGNKAAGKLNRAGFSPGSEVAGGSPTGLLFDDTTWGFDNTKNKNYDLHGAPGSETPAAITIYAMFYAEHTSPVFFGGRLYRQNPGAG